MSEFYSVFLMISVVSRAKTMEELRHAYEIRSMLHRFVMIGGTLLLITGLVMGVIRPYLFSQGWYVLILVLFIVGLAFGSLVLSPRSKPIKALLDTYVGVAIPPVYLELSRKLFFFERIENIFFY